MFDTVEHWRLKLTKLDYSLLQRLVWTSEPGQCFGSRQNKVAGSFHGYPKLPDWVSTHSPHGKRAEHLSGLISQALKIR